MKYFITSFHVVKTQNASILHVAYFVSQLKKIFLSFDTSLCRLDIEDHYDIIFMSRNTQLHIQIEKFPLL